MAVQAGNGAAPVYRRFSALEKLGRIGDEYVMDRWLSVHDAPPPPRQELTGSTVLSRRLTGAPYSSDPEGRKAAAPAAASTLPRLRHMRNCSLNR